MKSLFAPPWQSPRLANTNAESRHVTWVLERYYSGSDRLAAISTGFLDGNLVPQFRWRLAVAQSDK
ncbi:hypothetical protein BOSEA31B_13853 [Hyphomicrobiales bacterium]|nr:hypothetical protein BOSEA31B_13853 [Hyphomicrobiales bacterium]CAH1699628.1 hypothetical protein BOSEA1005_12681 [Hyphomicrobiales bacterium]